MLKAFVRVAFLLFFNVFYSCQSNIKLDENTKNCLEISIDSLNAYPKKVEFGDSLNYAPPIPCGLMQVEITEKVARYSRSLAKSHTSASHLSGRQKEVLMIIADHPNCMLSEIQSPVSIKFIKTHKIGSKSKFTAYYTPIFEASRYPSSDYYVPVYGEGQMLDSTKIAQAISDSVAEASNQNEVICYLRSYFDLYQLYLQGSAMVQLGDSTHRLSFVESSGDTFCHLFDLIRLHKMPAIRSLKLPSQRNYYLKKKDVLDSVWKNQDYRSLYRLEKSSIRGAYGAPLLAGHSIAADPNHYPFGELIIAYLPVIHAGKIQPKYELRILFASDVGSYIKGKGRFDLYMGYSGGIAQSFNLKSIAWHVQ